MQPQGRLYLGRQWGIRTSPLEQSRRPLWVDSGRSIATSVPSPSSPSRTCCACFTPPPSPGPAAPTHTPPSPRCPAEPPHSPRRRPPVSAQRFELVVRLVQGGLTRTAGVRGRDIYAVTAPIVVEAALRLLAPSYGRGGALAVAEALDPIDMLRSLHGSALEVFGDAWPG